MKADLRLSLTLEYAVADFALRASLQVGSETVALVGPNGAGKTTLLLAILGICTPQRGYLSLAEQVLFDAAQSISRPTEERRWPTCRKTSDYSLSFPPRTTWHSPSLAGVGRWRARGAGSSRSSISSASVLLIWPHDCPGSCRAASASG